MMALVKSIGEGIYTVNGVETVETVKKVTEQDTIKQKSSEDCRLGYYELAICYAAAKVQEDGFRWDDFIDNLSFICDKFAAHIKTNGKSQMGI